MEIWENRMANRDQLRLIKWAFYNDNNRLWDKFSGDFFKSQKACLVKLKAFSRKEGNRKVKALEHGAGECWESNVCCLKAVYVRFPRVPCVSSLAVRKLSPYSLCCILPTSWKFLLGFLASLLLPLSTFTLETLSWILSIPLLLWRCQILVWLIHALLEEDLTEVFCEQLSNSFAAATP